MKTLQKKKKKTRSNVPVNNYSHSLQFVNTCFPFFFSLAISSFNLKWLDLVSSFTDRLITLCSPCKKGKISFPIPKKRLHFIVGHWVSHLPSFFSEQSPWFANTTWRNIILEDLSNKHKDHVFMLLNDTTLCQLLEWRTSQHFQPFQTTRSSLSSPQELGI